MAWFYDCKPLELGDDGWVDVERIYCLEVDSVDEQLLDRLRMIFDGLPGSVKQDADGCHWWYSDWEDIENGYLTAGIEPPGLQVFGTLPLTTWQEWDKREKRYQRRS